MDAQLSVELRADIQNFITGMRNAATESSRSASRIESSTSKIGSAIKSTLAGAFSISAVVSFGKAVIDATAEYQKFAAVLGNTLGSSALANLKLKELQDFAAKTPFGVNELTAAYVKLANAGFKPTGEQITKLGDLASSTGKSFDQLTEAILDAQSGEFERLKEFGVRAKDAGDKVIFTYKGVQTQVEKTAGSIRDYITSLGAAEGVSGSMAKISETLGGQISNLGDTWDQMLLSVGKNTEGVFNTSIGIISAAIGKVTEFNRELSVASKYKIGGGFKDVLETLQKYSAAGIASGAGQTTKESLIATITNAQDSVSSFVAKAIDGAKATSDFGKALAALKTQGDKELKNLKNPAVIKGVSDAYQDGVKAIQDARSNFANAVTSDANFGTGKGAKGIKSISDILKELDENLRVTENKFKATFDEKTERAIDNYQTAIDALAKKGTPDAIRAISQLNAVLLQTQQLGQNTALSGSVNQGLPAQRNSLGQKGLDGINVTKRPDTFYKGITKAQQDIYDKQAKFQEDFAELTSGFVVGTLGDFGTSIGEALSSGGSALEAVGNALLKGFASFLGEFGKLLIAYGLAAKAKAAADAALTIPFIGAIAGPAAVIAGIALQVASGAIGALVGGGKKGKTGANVTAFADGGIVDRPTLGLMGEYPGAKTNPEVIAPLDKLKSMMGNSGNNIFITETVVRGSDLVTVYRKASGNLNRVG